MRFRRNVAVACIAGLLLALAATPAGAGRQTTRPVSLTIAGAAGATDVVGDGGAYAGTLSEAGSLEMRLPAGRQLTIHLGGQALECQPDPYWSKITVFTVSTPGLADARLDCAVTASGLPDGKAATPWLIDFPPYKYGPSPAPCVVVSGNAYTANDCPAKAYAGGFRRAGYDYLGPVDFSITTS